MSKRKRKTPAESGADESAEEAPKDDMVHVTSDMLAGSPDIFAGKKAEAKPGVAEHEVATEPIEPAAASTTLTAEPEPVPPAETPIEPASPLPPFVATTPYAARPRGGGSSALGIVLVVIGVFALVIVLTGTDLTQYGWPLFIIIPGLTLLVIGFARVGAGATIPGGILSVLGVVLAYCNSTNDWPFLAYGWALVTPGGVGLGIYLQALRDRDQHELRTGRTLLFIGLMIFLIGFVLFESILGISGRDYFGPIGKAALPVLLIVVGVILLVRSIQRSRQG
jgi:hypothetical protein